MAVYLADAVGLLRYLVDSLPPAADRAFARAEDGLDVIRAPDVQLAEVLYQVGRSHVIAETTLRGTATEALQRLVTNGPIDVAPIGEPALAVYGSLTDQYSMHDGMLVACHRVLETDGIISKDRAFAELPTVWE